MKSSYQGFYNPTEEELKEAWKSDNSIFIFDTNVLLNIYSYKEKTRSDFLLSLKTLNDKIWIPFHVGLEYQRRRLDVVRREKSIFRSVFDKLEQLKKFKENLSELEERFPELIKPGNVLCSELESAVNKYRKIVEELDKKQPCVRSHDAIREKLNILFNDRVGEEPTQEYIDSIEKEGETRYANKTPPGFKDSNKGDEFFSYGNIKYKNKYGDLIIWKQILGYVAKNTNINNVILITDDIKSDWWFSIDSGGKKIVGPNAFLINEIKKIKNVALFHMYTTSEFLSETNKYHQEVNISDSSIEETKDVELKNNLRVRHRPWYEVWDHINEIEKMKNLVNIEEIERIKNLVNIEEIERMKKLANIEEIERMKKLANIEGIERMKKLANIEEIERMKKLANIDEIERMKKLAHIEAIERMRKLANIDEIERMIKWANIDKNE